MSTHPDGGAAFPSPGVVLSDRAQRQQGAYEGMSLRQYAAIHFMTEIIWQRTTHGLCVEQHPQRCAERAFEFADAFLKASES